MTAVDYFNGVAVKTSTGSTWLFFDGTINAFETDAVVTHGLGITPTGYFVTPKDAYAVGAEVTAVGNNTITVSKQNAPPAPATFKVGVSA